jgi:hypothetical protein
MAAFSYWSKARTVEEIKNSYAGNIYAQDNLIALYRFDENIQINDAPNEVIVRNAAGDDFDIHLMGSPAVATYSGINGEFIGGYDQNLILTMSRTPVPVTKFAQAQDLSATLEDYVRNAQITASLYDKGNTNIITRMVPDAYLSLEEEIGTEVLQKFLYLIGRQFDQIKVAIDQFTNWNKSNYTGFDDTPDSLLRDAANFYGWDFVGNFLNHNALKYFFGKDVVQGSDLDVKLYQIKNEFWRRTLNELMHIYKTKGTRESVESLIRVYGMDQKLIKLKEYGVKPNGKIETNRINSHRSLPAFCIPSGTGDAIISDPMTDVDGFEIALHGKFYPLDPLDQPRGTICSVGPYELRYFGTAGSVTTSLALVDTISGITGAIGNVPIMDGHWWNIFATIPTPGGTLASNGFSYQFPVQFGAVISSGTISWSPGIAVQRLNEDTVVDRYAFSATYTSSTLSGTVFSSTLGHSTFTGGTFYVNEFKLYNDYLLNYEEMDAQTLDFQSYGVLDIDDLTGSLRLHWRLDDDLTIPAGVSSSDFKVFDFSGYGVSGTISSSIKADPYNPFRRFMYDYNFIAPVEYGWNENKIRVYDGSKINPNDYFAETNALALEFNLIDSLNEDISKMLATMNNWNNVLGVPANKFRENYPDLQRMRNYYFKKLEGRINFTRFADILEFFDRSFVKMIQRLLPARAIFYGEEFVIESHMLERPKVQWTYRRYSPELVPEGRITMTDRSGSFNSSAVTTISYS